MTRFLTSSLVLSFVLPTASAHAREHVLLARQVGVPALSAALHGADPDGQWAAVPLESAKGQGATVVLEASRHDLWADVDARAFADAREGDLFALDAADVVLVAERGGATVVDLFGGVCLAPDDGEALTGLEPDEIDAKFSGGDGEALVGVEPDEIDAKFSGDDGEALVGVEPDEIDAKVTGDDGEALVGVEPDEIDAKATGDDGEALVGVEPDEIDAKATGDDGEALVGVEPDEIDAKASGDDGEALTGLEPDEIDAAVAFVLVTRDGPTLVVPMADTPWWDTCAAR